MNLREKRALQIRKEGSPYYRWSPGAIVAATDIYIFLDTQFPASRKYAPLDWYEIVNNSTENLTITLNGTQQHAVPAGTSRKDDLTAITSFNIHNDSITDTTDGEVIVTFARQPITEDKKLRESQR